MPYPRMSHRHINTSILISTVVLHMAISNKRLKQKGLVFPLDHYLKVHTEI